MVMSQQQRDARRQPLLLMLVRLVPTERLVEASSPEAAINVLKRFGETVSSRVVSAGGDVVESSAGVVLAAFNDDGSPHPVNIRALATELTVAWGDVMASVVAPVLGIQVAAVRGMCLFEVELGHVVSVLGAPRSRVYSLVAGVSEAGVFLGPEL
jgi:hypothetical protein